MHALRLQHCFLHTPAVVAQRCAPAVQVIGIGHLAAAVRLELARRGGGGDADSPESPLIVVCSDFHNPESFAEMQCRAWAAGSPALFASLDEAGIHPRLLAGQGAIAVVDRVMGM